MTTATPLRAVFEKLFTSGTHSIDTIDEYASCVAEWSRFVGDIPFEEIGDDSFEHLANGMRAAGRAESRIRKVSQYCRIIWRRGLGKTKTMRRAPRNVPAKGTLRWIFENQYRPERMKWPAANTVIKWRQALYRFDFALQRPATVADLTADVLDAAEKTLAATISEKGRDSFRRHIHRLWWYLADSKIVTNAPLRKGRPGKPGNKLVAPPKLRPTPDPNYWEANGKQSRRFRVKRRLITIPQVAVEKMLPTDALRDLANAYVLRKLRGASEKTPERYRSAIDELQFLLDRRVCIRPDGREHRKRDVAGPREWPGDSDRERLPLKTCGAGERRLPPGDPEDVDKMTEPHRVPIGWTWEQLCTLFEACRQQRGTIAGIPSADWMTGLHAVLYDTGERVGAPLRARWDGLDFMTGWLVIRAELRKGKTEDKSWRLHTETLEFLRRIEKPRRDLIFPWVQSRGNLWERYDRMLRLAGLPHTRKHKFHCMRKTSASFFAAAGGDATAFLGHSGPAVTRVYMVPEIVKARQACDVLARPVASSAVLALLEGPRNVS